MPITAEHKQSSLDNAADEALRRGRTLREQLRAFEVEAWKLVSGGSLQQVSGAGMSTSFAASGAGQVTQAEIVTMWRQLINLYDTTKATLATEDDDAIKAAMMPAIVDYSESFADFSEMRR